MKNSGKQLTVLATCLTVCALGRAATSHRSGNDYENIPERNLFGLREPEAVKVPPSITPRPKILLMGITTVLGYKLVLMKAQLPPQAGHPGREESYMLTEGQREGDVEVLKINENTGDVKINNSGTVMTLNLDRDSPKITGTLPPGAPTPGMPTNLAAGVIPPPTGTTNSAVLGRSRMAQGQRSIPTRNYQAPAVPVPAQGNTPTASAMPALPQVNAQPQAQEPPMTAEEQMLLMELERERNNNNPPYPPSPIMPLTPGAQPRLVPQ